MRLGRRWFLGHVPAAATVAPAAGRAATPASALEGRLLDALDQLRLFDTHEHLIPESMRVGQPVDFFTLAGHYALNDLISAGLDGKALERVRDSEAPLEQRWMAFEPYWQAARFTGYGQALSLAMRDIYGVEEISRDSIGPLTEAIRKRNRPGLYEEVLRKRAGIDLCLVDAYWNEKPAPMEHPYFLLAQKFDGFVAPASRQDLERLQGISGVSIHTLAGLKTALEATFQQALKAGMAAVKTTLAYRRDLSFAEVPEGEAAGAFATVLKGEVEVPRGFRSQQARPFRKLEDHMLHHVVRLADAHRLPVQIHTGLLAGNGCFVENTNPTLLANLFFLYPRVKFDLFHIGYPYQQELTVLAKTFPNVYADFCWAHIISPPAARRALDEYLETIPVTKILGFGGDYRYPELTYAHARMARRNISRVLASKVEAGLFSEDEALQTGRLLLRNNPMSLFAPRRA